MLLTEQNDDTNSRETFAIMNKSIYLTNPILAAGLEFECSMIDLDSVTWYASVFCAPFFLLISLFRRFSGSH
jgi:hypothetical protein